MAFLRQTPTTSTRAARATSRTASSSWLVIGTTSPMTLSPDKLDAWVTQMTHWGRDHGSAGFDGWGAQTPSAPPPKKRKRLPLGRRGR